MRKSLAILCFFKLLEDAFWFAACVKKPKICIESFLCKQPSATPKVQGSHRDYKLEKTEAAIFVTKHKSRGFPAFYAL